MGKQSDKKKKNKSISQSQPLPNSVPETVSEQSFQPQPQNADQAKSHVRIQHKVSSGPIPPPQILSAYEQINPGLANRIMKMAEVELDHQHTLDKRGQGAEILEIRIGQFLGFFIGIAGIYGGVYMAVNGAPFAGGVLGSGGFSEPCERLCYRPDRQSFQASQC